MDKQVFKKQLDAVGVDYIDLLNLFDTNYNGHATLCSLIEAADRASRVLTVAFDWSLTHEGSLFWEGVTRELTKLHAKTLTVTPNPFAPGVEQTIASEPTEADKAEALRKLKDAEEERLKEIFFPDSQYGYGAKQKRGQKKDIVWDKYDEDDQCWGW